MHQDYPSVEASFSLLTNYKPPMKTRFPLTLTTKRINFQRSIGTRLFPVLVLTLMLSFSAIAQQRPVTGLVMDSNTGESLPGVNILVQGTSIGTVTDLDGSYRLEVPNAEAVLVFSFVGYEKNEVPVGNQQVLNVQLTPDQADLEEVVVIGYGTRRKTSVT